LTPLDTAFTAAKDMADSTHGVDELIVKGAVVAVPTPE
jgi:hypothetical protein